MLAYCKLQKALLIALTLTVIPLSLCHAETDDHLKLWLKGIPQGNFLQTKYLHDMPFPLKSEGHFTFNDSQGLKWHIETPVKSQLHIDRAGIVQMSDGQTVAQLDQTQHPVVTTVTQVFFALFAGDWSLLNEHFSIQPSDNEDSTRESNKAPPEHRSLSLKPHTDLLQQAIPRIDIRGREYIQHITIFEASGDKTLITLYPGK